MSREKDLAKNTVIISAGTFLPKLVTFITLPIMTSKLTKSEYGMYDMLLAVVSFLMPLVTVQIHTAAFRFLIECRSIDEERKKVVSCIYIFLIVPFTIMLFVSLGFLSDYDLETRLLFFVYFILEMLVNVTKQAVRGLSKNMVYSVSTIIQAVSKMLFIVLFVQVLNKGFEGAIISFILAEIICLCFLMLGGGLARDIGFRYFSAPVIKEMLQYSWPMIPTALSSWILDLSDRLVVFKAIGVEATAVYAAANKVPLILAAFQATFSFAWQENASLSIDDEDVENYYSSVFDMVFCMSMGIAGLVIASTPILFMLLIKGDYSEAYIHIPILLIGVLFSMLAAFFGGIYIAHKRTKDVGVSTIIAAAINLIIDIALVSKIGLFAASVSTLLSNLFLFTFRMYHVTRFQRIAYKYIKIIICIITVSAIGVICAMNKVEYNCLNFAFALIFAFLLNRKMINKVCAKAKNKFLQK